MSLEHVVEHDVDCVLEHVVLVDEQDTTLGTSEKIRAHELGLLHRAFSVFIYRKVSNTDADAKTNLNSNAKTDLNANANSELNSNSESERLQFLLQQRHADKYHCGNLWTNTCCSHPRLSETVIEGGERRLKEEMSLEISLHAAGSFIYRAEFSNGLTEHELDHVLLGEYPAGMPITVDPLEVQNFAWVTVAELQQALAKEPHLYTPWFKPALDIALERLCHNY